MPDYDIEGAFRAIENELLSSMIRNLENHRAQETEEGFEWTSWQTEQLNALNKYKQKNNKAFKKRFSEINSKIEEGIRRSQELGYMDEEISILKAIKKGFKAKKVSNTMQGEFFEINERKLDALIKATTNDMQKAETAMLRMANDQYRKVIFNAQVYANTGAGTYEQAVDMATKDYLSRGINCIEYSNGARVNIASYAAMAIKTANTRAYLQGEGVKRQEWGISTVIVNKRGHACLKCLKWTGKVLIDDVWSGGKASDGPYPLMSTAIAQGLYHPNCKDGHTTFFPGVSEEPKPLTKKDVSNSIEDYRLDQKIKYAQNHADRFRRLSDYSLDEENRRRYGTKADEWAGKHLRLVRFKTDGYIPDNMTVINNSTRDLIKEFEDVTEEYLSEATPKIGNLIIDEKALGTDKEMAQWVYSKLGGNIHCIEEQAQVGKVPDSKINGLYFEFKKPTTKNAIDSRIRKAQEQLAEALDRENNANARRGMIIDISDMNMTSEESIKTIIQITRKRLKGETDVIIREGDELLKILRFTK